MAPLNYHVVGVRRDAASLEAMNAPLRLQRTAALSVVVLALAAAAHGSAGGALPSAGHVMLLAAVVGLPAWFVTSRRVSPGALLLLVIGGQWLLHTAFGAMAHGPAAAEVAHHAAAPAAMPAAHALTPSMAAAHTAAAALVALWLAAGERLLFLMLDAATARPLRALRLLLVPASAAPSRIARETSRVLVLRRRLVGVALSWRGPPASVCFR